MFQAFHSLLSHLSGDGGHVYGAMVSVVGSGPAGARGSALGLHGHGAGVSGGSRGSSESQHWAVEGLLRL